MLTLEQIREQLGAAIRQTEADALVELLTIIEAARANCLVRLLSPQKPPQPINSLLDSEALAARTGIPATWWRDAARRGIVPHVRAGSYVRFSFEAVTVALANQPAMRRRKRTLHRIARPAKAEKAKSRKGMLPDCYRADVGDDGE